MQAGAHAAAAVGLVGALARGRGHGLLGGLAGAGQGVAPLINHRVATRYRDGELNLHVVRKHRQAQLAGQVFGLEIVEIRALERQQVAEGALLQRLARLGYYLTEVVLVAVHGEGYFHQHVFQEVVHRQVRVQLAEAGQLAALQLLVAGGRGIAHHRGVIAGRAGEVVCAAQVEARAQHQRQARVGGAQLRVGHDKPVAAGRLPGLAEARQPNAAHLHRVAVVVAPLLVGGLESLRRQAPLVELVHPLLTTGQGLQVGIHAGSEKRLPQLPPHRKQPVDVLLKRSRTGTERHRRLVEILPLPVLAGHWQRLQRRMRKHQREGRSSPQQAALLPVLVLGKNQKQRLDAREVAVVGQVQGQGTAQQGGARVGLQALQLLGPLPGHEAQAVGIGVLGVEDEFEQVPALAHQAVVHGVGRRVFGRELKRRLQQMQLAKWRGNGRGRAAGIAPSRVENVLINHRFGDLVRLLPAAVLLVAPAV